MIKITTKSGAAYLIDQERLRAKRVTNDTAPGMRYDGEWFDYWAITPMDMVSEAAEGWLGNRLHFKIANHESWDWRITTRVVGIELVKDEDTTEAIDGPA